MEEDTRAILTVDENERILFWKKMAPTLSHWQDDPLLQTVSSFIDRSFKPQVICQCQCQGHLLTLTTEIFEVKLERK